MLEENQLGTPAKAVQEEENAQEEGGTSQTSATNSKSLLTAEKMLIALFVSFVILTVFLIVIQSRWYYVTFALSLIVLLVTYKEGLVAMEDEE